MACSILPVATMNRKYAYLDYKIANSLLPRKERNVGTNQNTYGIGPAKTVGFDINKLQ
jgi:hypothetical protein